MVTYKRAPLLIENIKLIRESFKNSKQFYQYKIFAIVVLPDHIHMIINPETAEEYPKIISRIKHYFSRNMEYINENISASKISKREKGIWQRRYWEHTIRDEEDLNRHLDYIHYNPVKHRIVDAVRDWEYSSFHKLVKQGFYNSNWGSFNDVEKIVELELE